MAKTHILRIITGLVLCAMLHGCFILTDMVVEEPEPELTFQQRCEKSVADYIKVRLDGEAYHAFGFSDVIIHKPIEFFELEELEKQKKTGEKTGAEVDSLIAQKQRYIRTHNIERTAELSHFFSLKKTGMPMMVLESNYLLNDTLGIIDFSPEIMLELPDEYEEALNYYFYEHTLFKAMTYEEGRKTSNQFYAFFKSRQAQLAGVQVKSDFLFHTLKIIQQVRTVWSFNPDLVTAMVVTDQLTNGPEAIKEYYPREFSPLYEKREQDVVSGYYIFHKFIGRLHDSLGTHIYKADISPWYEVESFSEVSGPFETYLNN